jgi:hypothetical protein
MSKANVNPLQRKVAASVAKQYVLEAKTLNMSLSTYIAWLKRKANYTTPYDQMIADYEAQQQGQSPAEAQPEPEAQGSGQGEGGGEEGEAEGE